MNATCESCERRPAVTALRLPDDLILLCGTCLDAAVALGLIEGGAA